MADPKITPTVDEKSCCSLGCCGNKGGSKSNLKASIGRIVLGVILLGSMFFFGIKALSGEIDDTGEIDDRCNDPEWMGCKSMGCQMVREDCDKRYSR